MASDSASVYRQRSSPSTSPVVLRLKMILPKLDPFLSGSALFQRRCLRQKQVDCFQSLLTMPGPSESPVMKEVGSEGRNYEIYDRIEKAMVEDDESLRRAFMSLQEAFEESVRRKEDLKDTVYAVLMRERKDFEEALSRKTKEVENMSRQVDALRLALCDTFEEKLSLEADIAKANQRVQESEQDMLSAVEQLEKYKTEWDNLQEQASNKITPLSFSLHEIERATGMFDPLMKIKQGGYGPIYKGCLRQTKVAVKKLISESVQGRSEFQQEVHILSKLRHPNLVTLIGSCPDACIIIYEYLPNGSLEDRLRCRDNSTPLSWKTRIRIAAELCSVLIFLHSENIIYGDLKPDNILLDANYVSKISDFGICRVVNRNEESSDTAGYVTLSMGTLGYIDPHFVETGELTPKSDVYSFGVILLRLLTGNKPVVGLLAEMQKALDGERLGDILDPTVKDWPFDQARQLAHLAMRCCERNRTSRPDLASMVWRRLERMRASWDISTFEVTSEESRQIPLHFICPILLEIMRDPHIAADGYTYELVAVRAWFNLGHHVSPVTKLPLPHRNVFPNHTLRSAILEWQQQ